MRNIHIAAGSVNQVPLDWEANRNRILRVIEQARTQGVQLLCLPELCITGYNCEDTFFAKYVIDQAWDSLLELIPETHNIAVVIGLPFIYEHKRYNVAAFVVNGHLHGIVCKRFLCKEGVHYEPRWFHAWPVGKRATIEFEGRQLPIGDIGFALDGIKIGFEICQDAWVRDRPAHALAEIGVDIICNPSASHFAFGKYQYRKNLILEASRQSTSAYLYSNLLGCEAGRMIYDGDCIITAADKVLAEGPRFSYKKDKFISAVIDLDQLRASRTNSSDMDPYFIAVDSNCFSEVSVSPNSIEPDYWEAFSGAEREYEEFLRAVALGLFDYLRKTRSNGFVLSLSGGADSGAVAVLIYYMVELGVEYLGFKDFIKVFSYSTHLSSATTKEEFCAKLLTCIYQRTENNSEVTFNAAKSLASAVNAEFLVFDIDSLVGAYVQLVEQALDQKLTWSTDDLALQNIQARSRVPGLWLVANLKSKLLLTTSNRSEAAVGYATMDGDTAGGFNPIGGIDKEFLLQWLSWIEKTGPKSVGPLPILELITKQQPTAELRPASDKQKDEDDLMPYSILSQIEDYAVGDKKLPLEVYKLLKASDTEYSPQDLATWVKRFFHLWSINQWKRERYAPSLHVDDKNLDPKTWCRFPILSGCFSKELADFDRFLSEEN